MRLVLLGIALTYLAVTLVIPVLPLYARDRLHVDAAVIGLLMGGPALTAVVARPLAGMVADWRGARGAFLFGAATVAVTGALYPLCVNTTLLVADRLVLGLGQGASFAAATVWVVDLAPAHRRGWAIGLVGLVNYLVLALGAAVGPAILAASGGYGVVWLLAAALPATGVLLGLFAVRPAPAPAPPASAAASDAPAAGRWAALAAIAAPGGSLALAFVGYATLTGFTVVALDERGVAHGALVLSAYAIAVAGARLVLGRVPDRLGVLPTLGLACAAEAVGLLVIGFAPTLPVAVAGGALTGVGMSLVYPALGLRVLSNTDGLPQRQTAVASFGAFVDIGAGLGGPLVGRAAGLVGYPGAFGLTAALVGAAFVVQLLPGGRRRR
ncbi:MFS transporter [Micromonospora sp. NPDC050980]|uniref:MFS transporter n=1 Tax=Micromonospora sp. NPDC050980 TaxID=3155161 RepID=UPI003411E0F9